jgi:aspartyl-tRNA(Asn)/glutamyl-tRNA(Gln) amidotransferase subunit B
MSDVGELEMVVDTILANNAQSVTDFKAGKENALQYLVGQVMKETKGKANPGVTKELLEKKLVV